MLAFHYEPELKSILAAFSCARYNGEKAIGKDNVLRIYLDNCCYNRPYDDQVDLRISLETQAKLRVQEMIKEKEHELVTSYMLRFEISKNPYPMRKGQIIDFIRKNTFVYVSDRTKESLEKKADEIMATGIHYKDAVHIACAIAAKCDYLLTTDARMLKYQSNEIKLINPLDFIAL